VSDETRADDRIADDLARHGWSVAHDFLAPDAVDVLAEECRRTWRGGRFRRAGIGRGDERAVRPEVRGDHVRWIERPDASPAQRDFLDRLEGLREAINRETFLGLFSFEGHFAVYPPGAFYRRHLDRFRTHGRRVVSCILYLNRDWSEQDGGALRLYLDERDRHVDVAPTGGTLVAFLSARFEHEVLPARRERLSWAGWFRVRAIE